jgi:hypothetical protein
MDYSETWVSSALAGLEQTLAQLQEGCIIMTNTVSKDSGAIQGVTFLALLRPHPSSEFAQKILNIGIAVLQKDGSN